MVYIGSLFFHFYIVDSLLVCLEKKKSQSLKSKPVGVITAEVFTVFMAYETAVVDLKSAVYLYQLMVNLNILSDKDVKQKQCNEMREYLNNLFQTYTYEVNIIKFEICSHYLLGSLCRTLLCRKWFNYEGILEKGAQCNVYLDELVKGFLRDSDFKRQRDILRAVCEESKQLNGKDTSLKSFPNFKK